jgi:hypothetical protein
MHGQLLVFYLKNEGTIPASTPIHHHIFPRVLGTDMASLVQVVVVFHVI